MSIQNVGGSPEVPEYKTPDDVDKNFKPADVYNSQKIGNALAGIEQSVSREIEKAMADGVVDDTERQTLNAWLNKAQGLSNSIANIVSKTYEDFRARFDTVIQNIEQHIGAKDRSYEPTETDSQSADNWNTQIKKVAYAYMKELGEKTKNIKDDLEKADIALELLKDYLDGIEEASDIKLFNDYCNEYRNNKKVVAKNQNGKVYTEQYGNDMLGVVLPKEEQSKKAKKT